MEAAKHKAMAEEALQAHPPVFELAWRPTLGMKWRSESTTLHILGANRDDAQPAPLQLVNHFPSVKCIASKAGLFNALKQYYGLLGMEVFDAVPTTYIVTQVRTSHDSCFVFNSLSAGGWTRFCSLFETFQISSRWSVG
jgi:hypothetical protein